MTKGKQKKSFKDSCALCEVEKYSFSNEPSVSRSAEANCQH